MVMFILPRKIRLRQRFDVTIFQGFEDGSFCHFACRFCMQTLDQVLQRAFSNMFIRTLAIFFVVNPTGETHVR